MSILSEFENVISLLYKHKLGKIYLRKEKMNFIKWQNPKRSGREKKMGFANFVNRSGLPDYTSSSPPSLGLIIIETLVFLSMRELTMNLVTTSG